MNKRQREWLATASEDEIKAFAAAGEPEVGNMIDRQSFKEYFAAGIRGLRVSSTDHETAEAAYDEAQAKRDEWRADVTLPALDERALGIDGLNTTLHDKLYEATLRTETILHMGAMFSSGDDMSGILEEFFDDLDDSIASQLAGDMPFLEGLLKEDEEDGFPVKEIIFSEIHRHSCFGWLVQFATPVMTPHKREGEWRGNTFSWGYYNTRWFYGETFEETVEKAAEWADECRQEEREKVEAQEEAA
ncbi:hypothetical protein [Laribacter hongkongensis]|uniref:hypothetical protein n=1 Tax=Laribacter hongkongensis TaxID=168471 RepID=UPI001EFE42C9|nr:hypothetical protein [Laribacter hongkongensis]MCG9100484.1 hypothetical protein [Laribacter hongkongensis]MCG9113281.1 hypothetical protein [Laribacter hongkongensis]